MNAYPAAWLPTALRAIATLIAITVSALAAEPASETPPPATPPAPPVKEERIVTLDVHQVLTAPPKLCFGLALEAWKDEATGKIIHLYITKIRPGSSADDARLKPRTRIDRIDGLPVEQLTASFLKDGSLNKFFINRKVGEKVVLEVMPEGSTQPRTVVLTEKGWFTFNTRSHGVDPADQLRDDPHLRQ